MKKIERLLTLILALKNYGKMTAKDLSELMEVNIRTIYRDMDAISQMNIPLIASAGTDGGYEIMDHYFIPSVSLTKDEILALMISKKLIDLTAIPGFGKHIESSFLKIQNLVNDKEKKILLAITNRVDFNLTGMVPDMKESAYFENIQNSFKDMKTLFINYYSPKKLKTEEREIIPLTLQFYEGCWYLISHCKSRNAERSFRLDRIIEMKLTDTSYTLPDDFSMNKYNRIKQFKKDANSNTGTDLVMKMTEPFFELEKDKLLFKYYPWDKINGNIFIRINTHYPWDYLEYAIKMSRNSEITEPEELRNQLKSHLNSILKKYS